MFDFFSRFLKRADSVDRHRAAKADKKTEQDSIVKGCLNNYADLRQPIGRFGEDLKTTTESSSEGARSKSTGDDVQLDLLHSLWKSSKLGRETKASKVSASYWQQGTSKYRRKVHDDAKLSVFYGYFDALKSDPHLRSMELNNTLPESHLSKYDMAAASREIALKVKNKLLTQYIERSQIAISAQAAGTNNPEVADAYDEYDYDTYNAPDSPESDPIELANLRSSSQHGNAPLLAEQSAPLEKISDLLSDVSSLQKSLLALASASRSDVKELMAESVNLSPELFKRMAADESLSVRYCIAENYACPPYILSQLSEDDNPYIAHRAKKTLTRLHQEGLVDLCASEERNRSFDVSNVDRSAAPELKQSGAYVAFNQNEGGEVFEINQRSTETWNLHPAKTESPVFQELFGDAKSAESTYSKWLLNLAEAADTTVPDPPVPIEAIWLLIKDPNLDVRFVLAENYNIDSEMLEVLTLDENPYVAHRAQKTLARLQPSRVYDTDFASKSANQKRHG